MRIISGRLKGLTLASWKPSSSFSIRPMTDRVKESLFNVLAPYLHEEVWFLDLFSGTGSLSLEALSRGAYTSHGVESHPRSVEIMKKNQKLLPQPQKMVIHKQDVFAFLKHARKGPFHIIVADPPFGLKIGEKIMQALVESHVYIMNTVVVIETGVGEHLKNTYGNFYLFSLKDFNDKKLWFYQAKNEKERPIS